MSALVCIQGLQKLTLLDVPGKVACTIFTGGCNFRCPFCHNASLVIDTYKNKPIVEDEIFAFLKKFPKIGKIITKLEESSLRKSEKVKKSSRWGLLAFVAIPMPGTGGWTGSLIAALLDMRIKISFPVIALGVLIANLIMSVFSYGLLGAIGF